jgi:microcystin-dependent protein
MNLSRIAKFTLALGALTVGGLSASAQPFVGEIKMVAFNFAPVGYHECDGSLLPISQYTAVFSLLGTQFGGNGYQNFALPNLLGRVPLGYGSGAGLTNRSMGDTGGAETYKLTVAQLPAHTHPLLATNVEATVVSPQGSILAAKARVPLYASGAPNSTLSSASVGATGGNQPYAVLPPYQVVNFVIALEGIFPSRN